ncbi:short-chain dehydrogenase [Virgisporangium aliadipatigenens]|uniref:Short-chain dehydrogenase n=1 Tax=Virgisporangium aliadipatigenens TaxID=741659 RepID=A0A8J4DQZ9_9ACTN|nr:SDR family oxidoreductase [Virgisporangium aliadipatigenens]GIJ47109.1 short-chain dehydrogenase [Virgisporangium aliadipatigenens]
MTRTVVVSGGGTGIGRAVAETFAADGDKVVITGRRADVLERAVAEIKGDVSAVPADLTVPDDVRRVAESVDAVDVIVNNAGAGSSFGPRETLEEHAAAWRRELDLNVLTAVLLTEALLPKLTRPGGRIIGMSSIAALRGGGGAYSAAKAALHGWCLALAGDLGPEGITVNVVAPGFIAETEFFGGRMSPEGYASRVRSTVVGRAGAPEDVAAMVRYLASPEAGFVTGQVLQINGGALFGRG